ncbi:cobaltochelatase subunit CobT [Bordetella petrii]|nr:cobaltochelatase subunit CobT [Bordetella petrii]
MPREAVPDPFKRAVAACTRAIAGDHELEVVFGRGDPMLAGNRLRLPEPPAQPSARALPVIRGLSDSLALRRALHDPGLHRRLAPTHAPARAVYDAVEQARVEAIGTRAMRGMAGNLAAMLEDQLGRARLARARIGADAAAPLAEAAALMVRARLTGLPAPAAGERALAQWRDWIEAHWGADLDTLLPRIHDQDAYARIVRRLLDRAASGPDAPWSGQGAEEGQGTPSGARPEQGGKAGAGRGGRQAGEDPAFDDGSGADETAATADDMASQDAPNAARRRAARLPESCREPGAHETGYRPYTTEFDQVLHAQDWCGPQELDRLRATLDRRLAATRGAVGRLANRLQRHLMARQTRGWDFDQEEGQLDTARLARLVVDPMQPISFKQERDSAFRDTAVTLLIDNSGSMHGRPIAVAAACADILARTLERCGVRIEILGFTTRAWQGGRAREQWLKAGKPVHPGRLNEACHVVYKSAEQPWRRARRNLGLMMCQELLKENIDGEALLWAYGRLAARPEQRKILMMVSDGAPADDATLSANPRDYLEQHLRAVIDMIQTRSPVELVAIGIGHDVARYYGRAVTIDDPDQLAGAMTDQLARMLGQPGRRRGGARW